MITFPLAKPAEYGQVGDFYRTVGEDETPAQSEIVFTARDDGNIIGAVRLVVSEHGVFVLRTLNVAPAYQRQGIATRLVEMLIKKLEENACYCLPYPHLKHFYERHGFREIGVERLPEFLRQRYLEYSKTFAVIAMMKEA
jgi:predicted N-acetyltransferase YhbS